MRRDSWTVSDLHLEQYVLGELPAEEAGRVRDALRTDEVLQSRVREIEKSNEEILSRYPVERIAPLIRERNGGEERAVRRIRPYTMTILPAAAAILVVLSVFGVRNRVFAGLSGPEGSEVTRVKSGGTHLSIFRKTSSGAEELANGSEVRSMDVLQIGYTAVDARYGVIFSMDGRGVVTFHLPENYRGQTLASPELDRQGQSVLPFAYELDDAPGYERFFFVFSRSPFDVRQIEQAARALSSQPTAAQRARLMKLPRGTEVYSLTLKKLG